PPGASPAGSRSRTWPPPRRGERRSRFRGREGAGAAPRARKRCLPRSAGTGHVPVAGQRIPGDPGLRDGRLSARVTASHRPNPAAPAVGEWNAGDVAVHLAQAWESLPELAGGAMESPLHEPGDLAGFTVSMVRNEPGRDLEATAARIEAAASAYLATSITDEG